MAFDPGYARNHLFYVDYTDLNGDTHAQNLSSRLGKLLRILPQKAGANWQIVGFGLRNPWRFSFDRTTGDLWIGDVGAG